MASGKAPAKQEISAKVKYTALPTNEKSQEDGIDTSENVSLLENMESVSISDKKEIPKSTVTTKKDAESDFSKERPVTKSKPALKADLSGKQKSLSALITDGVKLTADNDTTKETPEQDSRNFNRQISAPEMGEKKIKSRDQSGADTNLDIVRKMSEPHSENYVPWRQIGPFSVLKQKRCQRVFAKSGRADDLALFYNNGKFHIMEAWCSHMGGPLYEGDIEDYNGKCHVMCPWHSYMFDLETGMNEIGLQQTVYELKLENAHIFVRYKSEVSIKPLRKPSEVVVHSPSSKQPARKESVLENVMHLK